MDGRGMPAMFRWRITRRFLKIRFYECIALVLQPPSLKNIEEKWKAEEQSLRRIVLTTKKHRQQASLLGAIIYFLYNSVSTMREIKYYRTFITAHTPPLLSVFSEVDGARVCAPPKRVSVLSIQHGGTLWIDLMLFNRVS